jgi:hypothetical protein
MTSKSNRRQEPARDLDLRYAPFLMCSSPRQTLRYCDTGAPGSPDLDRDRVASANGLSGRHWADLATVIAELVERPGTSAATTSSAGRQTSRPSLSITVTALHG